MLFVKFLHSIILVYYVQILPIVYNCCVECRWNNVELCGFEEEFMIVRNSIEFLWHCMKFVCCFIGLCKDVWNLLAVCIQICGIYLNLRRVFVEFIIWTWA